MESPVSDNILRELYLDSTYSPRDAQFGQAKGQHKPLLDRFLLLLL